jgi:hypothetical protein
MPRHRDLGKPALNLTTLGDHCRKFLVFGVVDRIGMIVVGKNALFDFLDILLHARNRDLGQLGIAFGEFRLE